MESGADARNLMEESVTQIARYSKRRGSASTKGQDYEVALCCLFFLRALRHTNDFFLASNHDLAGIFDDVVLCYRLKGDKYNEYRAILLQAKHREKSKQKKLTLSYPFHLKEYLESFRKIMNLWEQSVKVGNCEIQLNEIIMVLYTNTGCVICDSVVNVTNCPEVQHLQDFLNTGGRLLRISEAPQVELPQGEEISDFLTRLLLCTEQMSVETADQFLEQELSSMLNLTSPDIASKLKTELKRVVKVWWTEEGTVRYLTAESQEWKEVLEVQVRRLNGETLDIDSKLNLDFKKSPLKEFDIVHRFLKLSWICVRDEFQANAIRSRLLRTQNNSLIISLKSLDENLEEVEALWGKIINPTLVIDMSKDLPDESSLIHLQEAVQSDAGRYLVVIAKRKPPSADWTDIDVEPTWSVLHQVTRDRLLSAPVRFQGKVVALKDVVGSHVSDVMTDRVISSLCDYETEIKLGAALPEPLEYFVPRCLQRTPTEQITVETLINTNTLLFSYVAITSPNEFTNRFKTLYRTDNIKSVEYPTVVSGISNDFNISQLCLRLGVKGISGEFSMNGFRENVKEFIPFTWNCKEKIIVIEGPPGVGKSSFVTMLCCRVKEQFPEAWVLRLDMGRHTDYIKYAGFTEIRDIIEFLYKSLLKEPNNLERKLLEHSLSVTGNVFLFLDAFDEISPDFTSKCSDLLKGIAKTTRYRQMVVTTRPVTTKDVEEALETRAFILPVFSEEEQSLFLKYFSEAKGKKITEEEISSLHQSAGKVLEIPLLCRMAAEVLLRHGEQRLHQYVNPWRRVLLYELFVEQSIKERVSEKLELDTSKPIFNMLLESHKNSHLQNLHGLAVRKLMPVDQLPVLSVSTITPEEKLGLVVNTGDRIDFEHQTFAEYFLGCWLACHWEKCSRKLIRDVLLQNGFQFVAATLSWSLFDGFPLHMAVAKGDKDTVRALLSAGTTDRGGRSALHVAAMTQGDHREVWELLVASDKDLNKKDYILGKTAIKYAEISANWELVNVLLEKIGDKQYNVVENTAMKFLTYIGHKKRANIGDQKLFTVQEAAKEALIYAVQKDLANLFRFIWRRYSNVFRNESLLHMAAANNSTNVMKVLIEMLHKIDVRNDNRFTPLHECSRHGHAEAMMLLVDNGADLNLTTEDGHTALTWAAREGHLEIVKILSETGADLNIKTQYGETALTLAAYGGHLDVVESLLKNGADLTIRTQDGHTALTWAAREGHLEVVKILLENGSDLNIKTRYGETALTEAAYGGHLEVVKSLLKNGADLNIRTRNGYTALTWAAREGHPEVVKILLENGADLNIKAQNGETALTCAASEGHLEIVKILLENGADVNIKTEYGETALTEATYRSHLGVMKILLENGADLNIKTKNGHTALTYATIKGHLEMVKILLENGADMNAKNFKGESALMLAEERHHLEIVAFLSGMN